MYTVQVGYTRMLCCRNRAEQIVFEFLSLTRSLSLAFSASRGYLAPPRHRSQLPPDNWKSFLPPPTPAFTYQLTYKLVKITKRRGRYNADVSPSLRFFTVKATPLWLGRCCCPVHSSQNRALSSSGS